MSLQLKNNETVNNMNYVDASSINLSSMGSMGDSMGGGGRQQQIKPPESNSNITGRKEESSSFDTSMTFAPSFTSSESSTSDSFFGSFGIGEFPSGMPSEIPEGFTGEFPGGMQRPSGNYGGEATGDNSSKIPGGMQRPSGSGSQNTPNFNFGDMSQIPGFSGSSNQSQSSFPALAGNTQTLLLVALSVIVLAIGLLIAKFYKY